MTENIQPTLGLGESRNVLDDIRCSICGEYKWTAYHKCMPRWQYCLEGSGDYWQYVYAPTDEEAAEKAAEKEWDFESGGEITLWLRLPNELTATKYTVDVESEPVFVTRHAPKTNPRETRELKDDDDGI
jgi:hypothetical protein